MTFVLVGGVGGENTLWLSLGVDIMPDVPGVQSAFTGCPRGNRKLSGLSHGVQSVMS